MVVRGNQQDVSSETGWARWRLRLDAMERLPVSGLSRCARCLERWGHINSARTHHGVRFAREWRSMAGWSSRSLSLRCTRAPLVACDRTGIRAVHAAR